MEIGQVDNDEQELSFKSFITQPEPTAAAEPAVPQPEPAAVAPVQDAGSVTTEGDAATITAEPTVQQPASAEPVAAPVPEPPAVPVPPTVRFEDVIQRRLGWKAPDDVDPESLYETVADQVAAAMQMRKQLEDREKELAELRAKLAQPAAAPVAPAAPAPVAAEPTPAPAPSRFAPLVQPAAASRVYVAQGDNGAWVVKPEYAGSAAAFTAAEEWNKYEQAKAERANLLIENPLAIFEDARAQLETAAEKRAREIIEQQFKSQEEERARLAQEAAAAAARADQERALAEFDSAHAAEFYHLDGTGKPLFVFGTNEPIKTPFFQQFDAKYGELARSLPQADQLTLAKLAYDLTKAQFGSLAPQAPAAPAAPARPAAPATPTPTAADLKARFVDQRTAPAKAPGNMQPAPLEQMPTPPGNRFLDYVVQNQELEGNPVWDNLRRRG